LREGSRRAEGPGIDTQKYNNLVDKHRDYLSKFFDKNSMAFLEELGRGAPLQRPGTNIPPSGSVSDVMRAEFATVEAVGAAGRTAGQKFFGGVLGINILVATGMGRRIAAYTFTKLGEEQIMKHVEDALRDPEKAAALIKRYRELDMWEPSARQKQLAERALESPIDLGTEAAITAKDRLSRGTAAVSRLLKGHSKKAIERAVRFGLVPAQAESRRRTLEEDYKYGPPFVYEDNRIRYSIENEAWKRDLKIELPGEGGGYPGTFVDVEVANDYLGKDGWTIQDYITNGFPVGYDRGAQTARPPPRRPSNIPPSRAVSPASEMSNVSPVGPQLEPHVFRSAPPPPPSRQGPVSPDTVDRMDKLGIPLFSFSHGGYAEKKSGIMSIKCPPQQIVG
jgi:hypothetical protein